MFVLVQLGKLDENSFRRSKSDVHSEEPATLAEDRKVDALNRPAVASKLGDQSVDDLPHNACSHLVSMDAIAWHALASSVSQDSH